MRNLIALVISITSSLCATATFACSCIPDASLLQNDGAGLKRTLDSAQYVVHGHVIRVLNSDEVEVEVTESFKGASGIPVIRVQALGGSSAMCGRGPFFDGESGIFIASSSGKIGLSGKREAYSSMLEMLRKHRR